MPKITFIEHDCAIHRVDAGIGSRVMEIAINHAGLIVRLPESQI